MKNIFVMIGRVIAAIFLISTIAIVIIVFKDIDNVFTIKLVNFYLLIVFLFIIYSIVALSINIKRLKWKRISKLLFRWAIWSLGLWVSTVAVIYLTKGELRLTEKIFSSISITFGSVFGGLILGSRDDN